MKKCYLFCDKRSVNPATSTYIDIVTASLKEIGCEIDVVHGLRAMHHPQLIFVVSAAYFLMAKMRYPKAKIIAWQQGIVYEEAKLNRPIHKQIIHYIAEQACVRYADLLLFTSNGMLEYYQQHAHYHKNNYVIMPCFNMSLSAQSPVMSKFQSPTFVYAGNTASWQCFDTMLDVYAIVEKCIPSAHLFLYCKIDDAGKKRIEERGIKNYTVDYVSVNELQSRMQDYKYGFLLREKNWINYVATPTKMNSYLAEYVIPIFSDGVEDFNSKIDLGTFTLKAATPLNIQNIASMIISFEKERHDFNQFVYKVHEIFDFHYNTDSYKTVICSKLKALVE
jgi:hypothetical protein